jgi:hypothetical protein
LSYRRRHLKKQAGERDNVEKKKREAAAVDLTTGQPLAFYCGADGLTEHRTISPKDRVGTKGSNLTVESVGDVGFIIFSLETSNIKYELIMCLPLYCSC